MSARVLNPAMMTEMSRNLGGGRAAPSRAALARVRRDLFGPVDHAAARACAERELRAQSLLDAEKWGFDFRLEIPKGNSRYEWELVTARDVVPEPYALRGMPYLGKHAPAPASPKSPPRGGRTPKDGAGAPRTPCPPVPSAAKAEKTPPQEPRVPDVGARGPDVANEPASRAKYLEELTTPVLARAARKQPSITDFMKSRKRTLNGSAKSMVEPPEKMARNAGQIRS
ncbi:cyclin-dependent kinase inhibitor 1C [Orussus abietinus]|uniref:cyclin-dependent kinase inhibitor 1C n=1 Tax=Orussus abietinus TaxID=222816 RepID=UPI000625E3EA|nr:cyclin-dependent kinase inhibitor 1C [Orussus abietinus]